MEATNGVSTLGIYRFQTVEKGVQDTIWVSRGKIRVSTEGTTMGILYYFYQTSSVKESRLKGWRRELSRMLLRCPVRSLLSYGSRGRPSDGIPSRVVCPSSWTTRLRCPLCPVLEVDDTKGPWDSRFVSLPTGCVQSSKLRLLVRCHPR